MNFSKFTIMETLPELRFRTISSFHKDSLPLALPFHLINPDITDLSLYIHLYLETLYVNGII